MFLQLRFDEIRSGPCLEKFPRSAMAAQCDALTGYLQQSDQGSNSERSTDSPLPGSEEDLSGPHPLPDPEWTEERFRVDRKKLEVMLLGNLCLIARPRGREEVLYF